MAMASTRTGRLLLSAVWLVLAGALVREQLAGDAASATAARALPAVATVARTLAGGEEWLTVHHGSRRVGWTHRSTAVDREGFRFSDESDLLLALLGTPQRLHTSLRADADTALRLRSFRFDLTAADQSVSATGRVEHGRLNVDYAIAGRAGHLELDARAGMALPFLLRSRIAAARPRPGDRFVEQIFDPTTMQPSALSVTVAAIEPLELPTGTVQSIVLDEEQGALRSRAWLAPDGGVLREESPLGFSLVRATREHALAPLDEVAPLDLALASRVPVAGEIKNPRTRATLALHVGGAAADRIPDVPPRQQRDSQGKLRIERETLPATSPPPDTEARRWLGPSPFVESDDPVLVRLAREIAAPSLDPVERARRIVAWVAANLDKRPSASLPSAMHVLETRAGDCNEHAVLVAALARAAGVPARVIAGLVYQDGAFWFHAWNELWLGRWVAVDATFAQVPADATHVRILEGGPEAHLGLAPLVSAIELSVVAATPAEGT